MHNKRKTISSLLSDFQSGDKKSHSAHYGVHRHPTPLTFQEGANRVVKRLESGSGMKSNYRQR